MAPLADWPYACVLMTVTQHERAVRRNSCTGSTLRMRGFSAVVFVIGFSALVNPMSTSFSWIAPQNPYCGYHASN